MGDNDREIALALLPHWQSNEPLSETDKKMGGTFVQTTPELRLVLSVTAGSTESYVRMVFTWKDRAARRIEKGFIFKYKNETQLRSIVQVMADNEATLTKASIASVVARMVEASDGAFEQMRNTMKRLK